MQTLAAKQSWAIHWFRRDLRIHGNSALQEAFQRSQGRVLGVFFFDSEFLARPDFSHHRFAFFLQTLQKLKEDFSKRGGTLWVMDVSPLQGMQNLLQHCKAKELTLPSVVTWNRDYEPFARDRDGKVQDFIESMGVSVTTCRDHLIIEPHEINKPGDVGSFYQVYSPFFKKWHESIRSQEIQKRIDLQKKSLQSYSQKNAEKIFAVPDFCKGSNGFPVQDALDQFQKQNQPHVTIPIPDAGFDVAYQRLLAFRDQLPKYQEQRDFPSVQGTSRLSHFFKNGSLTTSQVLATLGAEPSQYVKEIAWREFYYSILYHRPDVERRSFLAKYENIKWENNTEYFELWCKGLTGFPIIDAGMRELKQSGFMHNRVRMIVASFLTKDLLIDWRWGEKYFMKELLDGDLAPNNGGWQWAASTGCDPQPYFRIFNPWLQSSRFDPDAIYIKKWVPELSDCSAKAIHDPSFDRTIFHYPNPMVDHAAQKPKALALYR